MAVLQSIKKLFVADAEGSQPIVPPTAKTTYRIRALTTQDLKTVLHLNARCFKNGENYTKNTFTYLLSEPNSLCYQIVTDGDIMAGFLCVLVNPDGVAHITTIGIAPEHRRRRLGMRLLLHLEDALRLREIVTAILEVRSGNIGAQELYKSAGYAIVQKMTKYYGNGEDAYLMVKSFI